MGKNKPIPGVSSVVTEVIAWEQRRHTGKCRLPTQPQSWNASQRQVAVGSVFPLVTLLSAHIRRCWNPKRWCCRDTKSQAFGELPEATSSLCRAREPGCLCRPWLWALIGSRVQVLPALTTSHPPLPTLGTRWRFFFSSPWEITPPFSVWPGTSIYSSESLPCSSEFSLLKKKKSRKFPPLDFEARILILTMKLYCFYFFLALCSPQLSRFLPIITQITFHNIIL